ncbi:MAG: hypothetical protein H0W20_02155 [Chthoniobacterales bacterium]|nr:hypothetical protein [Chthoniobacterales bacterium]
MKQNRFTKMLAVGAVSALALSTAFAQTTTKETTTTGGTTGTTGVSATTTTGGTTGVSASTTTSTSALDGTGTITTFTPGTKYMTVRTESSADPVRYYYSDDVTVVDQAGATVDMSLLRSDLPVRYSYVKEGDRMVISRITVQKPLTEIKETTTTTTTTK